MMGSLRQRIRSLERKLILELTELRAQPVVTNLLCGWEAALAHRSRLPDPHRFVRGLFSAGLSFLRCPPAVNYLDECAMKRSFPDGGQLLRLLLWRPAGHLKHHRNNPLPLGRGLG